MGIAPYLAEAIIREHKHRRIEGDVLLLGRQSMFFSLEQAHDMLRAEGIEAVKIPGGLYAVDRSTSAGQGNQYIKDSAFFALLGAKSTKALDHSAYEGAEIIHDLNTPVPDDLENIADFILDGSTLDNLFNPSTAVQSITRMLRPGGRFLSANMGSPHRYPYIILTPFWFYDYLSLNNYADYRVYITAHTHRGDINVFTLDTKDAQQAPTFPIIGVTGIVVFAEKGPETTWHKIPAQRFYAGQEMVNDYASAAIKRVSGSRPELLRSGSVSLSYSPFRHLIEYYSMAAFITHHFSHIDHHGKRQRLSARVINILARLTSVFRKGS